MFVAISYTFPSLSEDAQGKEKRRKPYNFSQLPWEFRLEIEKTDLKLKWSYMKSPTFPSI